MELRFALAGLFLVVVANADTLTLKNGSTINGSFVSGDNQSVRFQTGSQVNSYSLIDIDALRFTSSSSASNPAQGITTGLPPLPELPNAPAAPSLPSVPRLPRTSTMPSVPAMPTAGPAYSSSVPTGPPSNSNAPYSAPPNTAGATNVEIPSGTQIVVRLIDAADSQNDSLGQTYRASVEKPVVMNGQTLIPRGSDAVAVLSDQQKSGRIEGKTILTIALRSVSVNGQTYDLATSSVNKSSGSRTTKSSEIIGGGAVLGAILGGLAGGGRGAAIGAVSGGAVGTGVQVATTGERVKIPSETVLTFVLQNPLSVTAVN